MDFLDFVGSSNCASALFGRLVTSAVALVHISDRREAYFIREIYFGRHLCGYSNDGCPGSRSDAFYWCSSLVLFVDVLHWWMALHTALSAACANSLRICREDCITIEHSHCGFLSQTLFNEQRFALTQVRWCQLPYLDGIQKRWEKDEEYTLKKVKNYENRCVSVAPILHQCKDRRQG